MMTAMMIHFPLAIAYGLAGAWLAHRFDWAGALMIGAAFGLAIYPVNFYMIAPGVFPWFTMAQNWVRTAAAALHLAGLQTDVKVLDKFAQYYVFFYSGYAFAPLAFRLAGAASARPRTARAAAAARAPSSP